MEGWFAKTSVDKIIEERHRTIKTMIMTWKTADKERVNQQELYLQDLGLQEREGEQREGRQEVGDRHNYLNPLIK